MCVPTLGRCRSRGLALYLGLLLGTMSFATLVASGGPAFLAVDHFPDFSSWHDCGSPLTTGYTERHFEQVDPANKNARWYAVGYYVDDRAAAPAFAVVVYVEPINPPLRLSVTAYSFDASSSEVVGAGPSPLADTGGQGKAIWALDSDIVKHFIAWMRSRDNPPSRVLVPGYALNTTKFNLVTGIAYAVAVKGSYVGGAGICT